MNMPVFREDQVSDEEAATIAEFLAANYVPALQAAPSALDKALTGLGGQEALQNLAAFSAESQGMRWTIDEQFSPGASAGPAGTFSLQMVYDIAGGNLRLDYTRQAGAGERQVSEIIAGDVGYLDGQDAAFGAPASVAMTSDRWASILKQQRLLNPHLLLRDLDPADVSDGGERIFNGTVHHRLVIADDVAPITLYVDAGTGQISKLETMENDHLRRDVPLEVFYYGWQSLGGGVAFPAEIYLALDGEIVHKEVRTALSVNPEVDSSLFDAPDGVTAEVDEDLAMRGALSGEFNQLFAASGFIKDGAQTAINADEIAPGIFLLGGVANNTMVVEQEDGIVVVDAPLHQYRSEAVIDWIASEFPDKPITHVASTHHHTDHSAGLRSYVAQGATVVLGEAAADYFADIFQAASTILPDALAENPVPATIEAVPADGSVTIDDDTYPVVVYPIANTHAEDMVIVYVGGAGVVFVSDLYSPNPAATSAGAGGQLLYDRITELGLEVETIAGGHGGSISFEDFEGQLE
jgi:glyoxylase-like metal-dependent hydrolase (beta-lactamase superfamily II)